MITKEQHGNCSKEASNKDCEGAKKSESDTLNSFDPGGKDGSCTTMSKISEVNVRTDNNGPAKGQASNKIHSELTTFVDKSEPKGEKTKQVDNDTIELSKMSITGVGNGTTMKNTNSHAQPPLLSSAIPGVQEPKHDMSDNITTGPNKDENRATPGLCTHNTANPSSTNDTTTSIQQSKTSSGPRPNKRYSFSRLPLLFERATPSYFTPRFDSRVLEEQYWKSTFPQTTRRFQLGLIYLLFLTMALSIYFPAGQRPDWPVFLGLTLGTVSIVAGMLGKLTFIKNKYFKTL